MGALSIRRGHLEMVRATAAPASDAALQPEAGKPHARLSRCSCLPDSCSYNNIRNPVQVLSSMMMIYWSRFGKDLARCKIELFNFVGARAMLGTVQYLQYLIAHARICFLPLNGTAWSSLFAMSHFSSEAPQLNAGPAGTCARRLLTTSLFEIQVRLRL